MNQEPIQVMTQGEKRTPHGPRRAPEDVDARGELLSAGFHKFTKLPPHAVPFHGRPHGSADGIAHTGAGQGFVVNHRARQRTGAKMSALPTDSGEDRSAPDAMDQALRR